MPLYKGEEKPAKEGIGEEEPGVASLGTGTEARVGVPMKPAAIKPVKHGVKPDKAPSNVAKCILNYSWLRC